MNTKVRINLLTLAMVLLALSMLNCTRLNVSDKTNADEQNQNELPNGAIPFIDDGHLYLKARIKDSLDVTLVYDTGADYLYLDEDYVRLNGLQKAFGKTTKAKLGGAGNGGNVQVDVIINPVDIQCGGKIRQSKIVPIIKLREILGCHTDGLLGNKSFISKPLFVSFSEHYILPLDSIDESMLDGYTKLKAKFNKDRIDVQASLKVDEKNVLTGLFRIDMGSGSGICLTKDATSKIDMSNLPHVFYHTQAGGIGGASDNITLRANSFSMTDTLSNLVVDCSLNEKGSLASSEYVGLIGTKILSLYNIIFSPQEQAVYLKRICDHKKYSKGSTLQMVYFDRTDICEGWIVNGLFKDGIAEKAGIEIGDIIIAINGRHVKEITWEEQMNIELKGKTIFLIKKTDGSMKEYTLNIDKEII